jgi:hypothetical protein
VPLWMALDLAVAGVFYVLWRSGNTDRILTGVCVHRTPIPSPNP